MSAKGLLSVYFNIFVESTSMSAKGLLRVYQRVYQRSTKCLLWLYFRVNFNMNQGCNFNHRLQGRL